MSKSNKQKHPIQPLSKDNHGVIRFKKNAIVAYLLDNGGIDMNKLAVLDFKAEDREQFAQLIGYSLSGLRELDYVTDETYLVAYSMLKNKKLTEQEAIIDVLNKQLTIARKGIKTAATALFRIHQDDLHT